MNAAEKALLEFNCSLLGLDYSEVLSALSEEKEGKPVLKANEVKSYFDEKAKAKLKEVEAKGKEEARNRAIKETYDMIEKQIKSDIGVDLKWNDGGLEAIKEHFEKSNAISDDDVRQSPLWKEREKEHKAAIKQAELDNEQKIHKLRSNRIKDKALTKVLALTSDKRKRPEDEEIDSLYRQELLKQLYSEEYRPELDENDDLIMVDSKGKPLLDDVMNKVTFDKFVQTATKIDKFYPKIETDGKDSGGAGSVFIPGASTNGKSGNTTASSKTYKYKNASGMEVEYQIPQFKTITDYLDAVESLPQDAPPQLLDELEKARETINEK